MAFSQDRPRFYLHHGTQSRLGQGGRLCGCVKVSWSHTYGLHGKLEICTLVYVSSARDGTEVRFTLQDVRYKVYTRQWRLTVRIRIWRLHASLVR